MDDAKVSLPVSNTARRVVFGIVQRGSGSAEIRALTLRMQPVRPTLPDAMAVLDEAISQVRERAYYSSRIDWNTMPGDLRLMSRGATSSIDVYPVIQYLLLNLGDRHSSVLLPLKAQKPAPEVSSNPPLRVAALPGGLVHVSVPAFVGMDASAVSRFASDGAAAIQSASAAARCGWIVDLREDTGGNMRPMLGALRGAAGIRTLRFRRRFEGKALPGRWGTICRGPSPICPTRPSRC